MVLFFIYFRIITNNNMKPLFKLKIKKFKTFKLFKTNYQNKINKKFLKYLFKHKINLISYKMIFKIILN